MSRQLRETPLSAREATYVRSYYQPALLRALHTRPEAHAPPLDPVSAYTYLFGARPDAYVQDVVSRVAAGCAARRRPKRPQWVYAFVDTVDAGAHPRPVKIGGTTRDARARVAQWERTLYPADGGGGGGSADEAHLVMLFAYPTQCYGAAERILHALLLPHWVPRAIARASNRRLKEYFMVRDANALRYLVKAVTRYIDWAMTRRGAAEPNYGRAWVTS
jgi:hypothetical protein